MILCKQYSQKYLCLLSVTQGGKRTVKYITVHLKQIHLPAYLPKLIIRIRLLDYLYGVLLFIRNYIGKIVKHLSGADCTSVLILSQQQF